MSTHNICFCGEIRKILFGYPLLSVAMHFMSIVSCLAEKIFHIVSFTPHAKCNVQNKMVFTLISVPSWCLVSVSSHNLKQFVISGSINFLKATTTKRYQFIVCWFC